MDITTELVIQHLKGGLSLLYVVERWENLISFKKYSLSDVDRKSA